MAKQQLVSSPIRKEVVCGVFVLTAMNVQDKFTKEYVCSMIQGEGRNWREATQAFWADVPENSWLTPRVDM